MNKIITPPTIAPPHRNIYSHGVEVAAAARTLYISGQLGLDPAGNMPGDFRSEAENVMNNLAEVLKTAGMTMGDLVKMNAYLTRSGDLALFQEVRTKHLAGTKPAMTTIFVAALASPEWSIEVDAVAAKAQ